MTNMKFDTPVAPADTVVYPFLIRLREHDTAEYPRSSTRKDDMEAHSIIGDIEVTE